MDDSEDKYVQNTQNDMITGVNEQDDITTGVDDPNKTNEMTTEPENTHNNTQSTPEEENDPNKYVTNGDINITSEMNASNRQSEVREEE